MNFKEEERESGLIYRNETKNEIQIPAVTCLLFPQNSTVSFRKELAKQ